MSLKFETLEKFRNKYEELNYYLIEYEGFIEDNGAPFCDFLFYHSRSKKFNPIQTFIGGVKRMENILKSYSRKIEFGDILKRVQETIRKERADEKKKKRKKYNDENKQLSQNQINGKMITEMKQEMKDMREIIESQNDMIKQLLGIQQPKNNELDMDNDENFDESKISSSVHDARGVSHQTSINANLSLHGAQNFGLRKPSTQSHQPKEDDWD